MKVLIFCLSFLSLSALAAPLNELTLYIVPSPLGMNWESPQALAQSALKNRLSFKPRFMGHVFVELKCGNQHELTGMVGKNFDYLNQLLVEQKGLGILFHSFEGRLENKDEIEAEIAEYLKTGHVSFTKFLVNESQCKKALQYLDEYRKHNVGRYYGLANRPRYGEGSGCSAFGVSFLELLDLLDWDMKESWSQTVNVPIALSGPPLKDQKVSLLKILFNTRNWASVNEEHRKLTFWDPDQMHKWIKKRIKTPMQGETSLKIQASEGIVINKTHYPKTESSIWLQRPKQMTE